MSELSQIAPRENQALKKFTLFLFSFVLAFAFPIVFQIKTVALENQGFFWAHDYARALETFYFIALALLVCLVAWSYHSFLRENPATKRYLMVFSVVCALLCLFNVLVLWVPFLFEHYASYFKSIRFGTLLWLACTILYLKNYRYHYKKIS